MLLGFQLTTCYTSILGLLSRVTALPEVRLLPCHWAPGAEEAPQVTQCTPVERVLVSATVFEVRDAVTRHELPRRGVYRDQIKVGTQEEENSQRQQGHHDTRRQEHTVRFQPHLPRGGISEARPENSFKWGLNRGTKKGKLICEFIICTIVYLHMITAVINNSTS